jgi:hypothetical protein
VPNLYNPSGTVPQATAPLAVAIAGSTNASPIAVTATGHGYNDGDTVVIEGHLVNTAANGRWQIHRIDANTYSLIGSTGNGVGGSTGYGIDYSINPVPSLPSGGDTRNASSVNGPIEAALNGMPFLFERVGLYRNYSMQRLVHVDTMGGAAAWSTTTVVGAGAWHPLTSAAWAYQDYTFSNQALNVAQDDILLLDFSCRATFGVTTYHGLGIGVSLTGGAPFTLVSGSPIEYSSAVQDDYVRIWAQWFAYDGPTSGNANPSITFGILGQSATSSEVFTLYPPYHFNVIHFRRNVDASWGP